MEVELGRSVDKFVRFVETAEDYQGQAISLVSPALLSSARSHSLRPAHEHTLSAPS